MSCKFIQNPYQSKINKEISQSLLLIYLKQNSIYIKRLLNLNENNYFINNRITFIKDIFNLIKTFRFKEQTAFKAIIYLDYILYNNEINSDVEIASIVLSSFIIACKFCEIDPKIPNLIKFCETFMQITNFKYAFSRSEINFYEMFCLKKLEYKLNVTTMYDVLNFFFNSDFFQTQFFSEHENSEKSYYKSLKIIEDILLYEGELYISDNPYLLVKYIVSYILEFYFNNEISKSFNKKFNDKEKLKEINQNKLLELLNKKFGRKTDYVHLNNNENYLDTILSIREDSTLISTDNSFFKNKFELKNNPKKNIFLNEDFDLKSSINELNNIFRRKKLDIRNLSVKNYNNNLNFPNSFLNNNNKLKKYQSKKFENEDSKNRLQLSNLNIFVKTNSKREFLSMERKKKKIINLDYIIPSVILRKNSNRNHILKNSLGDKIRKKYCTLEYNNDSIKEKNNTNNFSFRRSFISHY